MEIQIEKVSQSRLPSVDINNLAFGQHISDHMFLADFENGAWINPRIVPYQNLSLSPLTLAIHYGQSIFEGMKAFKTPSGKINIFRPAKHHERMSKSLERMCMPLVPMDLFMGGLETLIDLDRAWVPEKPGYSLYVRPFAFASEPKLGLKVADRYTFCIVISPVSPFYGEPVRVKVESNFIRAAEGGTGTAKCAGNYGGSFYPAQLAKKQGFDQILWTDAREHKYFEESGTMNLMFVIDGVLTTPALSGTILDGITRDSLIKIAGLMGIPVQERRVSVSEIAEGIKSGKVSEAFGAGTAAIVAPIKSIAFDNEELNLPPIHDQMIMIKLKNELEEMRHDRKPDTFNWNHLI
jgi:branched-chain amino acid aminotransferase